MSKGVEIVEWAKGQLNKRYVFGSTGPNTFDCSGLVQFCHSKVGINIPRISTDQSKGGVNGDGSPGDVVCFATGNDNRVSHVGICVGGGQFIHAPNDGDVVKYSSYNSGYYRQHFVKIRRYWGTESSESGFSRGGNGNTCCQGMNWLPDVSGFNGNDSNNGYAGIFGRNVKGVRVNGGTPYRVHVLGGGWLNEVTGNNQNDCNNGYSGNGRVIDGFAIQGTSYAVHLTEGRWLPSVTGYNLNDGNNGYAGILGKPIDAIMINGRNYATAY